MSRNPGVVREVLKGMPREELRALLAEQTNLMSDLLGRLDPDTLIDFLGLYE